VFSPTATNIDLGLHDIEYVSSKMGYRMASASSEVLPVSEGGGLVELGKVPMTSLQLKDFAIVQRLPQVKSLESNIRVTKKGRLCELEGTIRNPNNFKISSARLSYASALMDVGDIDPGGTAKVRQVYLLEDPSDTAAAVRNKGSDLQERAIVTGKVEGFDPGIQTGVLAKDSSFVNFVGTLQFKEIAR
jgi:hypothetical protein